MATNPLEKKEKQPNPFRIRIGNLVAFRHEKHLNYLLSQIKPKSIHQKWIPTQTKTGLELVGKHVRFYPSLLYLHISTTSTPYNCTKSYRNTLNYLKSEVPDSSQWLCGEIISILGHPKSKLSGTIVEILIDINIDDKPQKSSSNKHKFYEFIIRGPNKFMIQTILPSNPKYKWEILSTIMTESTKQSLLLSIKSESILPIQNVIIHPNNYAKPKQQIIHHEPFFFLLGEVLSMQKNNQKNKSLTSLASLAMVTLKPLYIPEHTKQKRQIISSNFELLDNYDNPSLNYYVPIENLIVVGQSIKRAKPIQPITYYIQHMYSNNLNKIIPSCHHCHQFKTNIFQCKYCSNKSNTQNKWWCIDCCHSLQKQNPNTPFSCTCCLGICDCNDCKHKQIKNPKQIKTTKNSNNTNNSIHIHSPTTLSIHQKDTKKRILSNQIKLSNKKYKPSLQKISNLCSRFQIYNRTNKSTSTKPPLKISTIRGSKCSKSQLRQNIHLPTNTSRASRANQRRMIKHSTWNTYEFNMYQISKREPKLRFGRSSIHQWGVFADESIRKNDMILEYRGELIGNAMADKREQEYENTIGSDYMFRIDAHTVCDATKTGSLARYINASCNPNCKTQINIIHGIKKIFIYAKKNISQGQELSYDYKFPMEYDQTKRIPCHCKAKNCRGYMNWDKKYNALEKKKQESHDQIKIHLS